MPLWAQICIGIWMAGVVLAAFLYLPPARGFARPEAARIVVFHVPCALTAVIAYFVSAAYAIGYLRGRNLVSDARCAASAGLGLLFTVLATATGMVFAQVQWGAAWNWDPRQTSIVMLMLVYAAYFALRDALRGDHLRARVSAAYSILAGAAMPYLMFVLPRMTAGLHPTSTLTDRAGLSTEYRAVLAAVLTGVVLVYLWILRIEVRIAEHDILRTAGDPGGSFAERKTND